MKLGHPGYLVIPGSGQASDSVKQHSFCSLNKSTFQLLLLLFLLCKIVVD